MADIFLLFIPALLVSSGCFVLDGESVLFLLEFQVFNASSCMKNNLGNVPYQAKRCLFTNFDGRIGQYFIGMSSDVDVCENPLREDESTRFFLVQIAR